MFVWEKCIKCVARGSTASKHQLSDVVAFTYHRIFYAFLLRCKSKASHVLSLLKKISPDWRLL